MDLGKSVRNGTLDHGLFEKDDEGGKGMTNVAESPRAPLKARPSTEELIRKRNHWNE